MTFTLHADGKIRGTLDGRSYIGRAAAGGAADVRYRRVQAIAKSSGMLDVVVHGATALQKLEARNAIYTSPGAAELTRETLEGYTVTWTTMDADGKSISHVGTLPADWDEVYRGRGWEPSMAAECIWAAEGFLLPPGMTPVVFQAALDEAKARAKAG